jgi:hypothetical protein
MRNNIRDLKYGSYEVVVKNNKDEVLEVVTVKAFGESHAIEKVSKTVPGTYFTPKRL